MRQLVPADHPALHRASLPVPAEEITNEHIRKLIREMKDVLAGTTHGVAIAAPQVGEALQIFVVRGNVLDGTIDDPDAESTMPDVAFINPEITNMSREKKEKHEGCLSLPGLWGHVPRAEKVTLRAYDESGKRIVRGASGLLAQVFQHEVDHLHGILYTERAAHTYEENEKEEPAAE